VIFLTGAWDDDGDGIANGADSILCNAQLNVTIAIKAK